MHSNFFQNQNSAFSILPSPATSIINAMNVIALIYSSVNNNATNINANASEDHDGKERSICKVEQGSAGFEFVS